MRIGIQCERCRVVSQILLNGFDIVTRAERGDCITVPQIVETRVWNACFGSQLFKMQINRLCAQILSE